MEVLTNKEKTKNKEVEITTPAFSITKVQASLGVAIAAVLAAVPASLRSDEAVVITAIAAGTALLLGVFALAAVDIRTRQRAREATLRFGSDDGASASEFVAVPDGKEKLVLQVGHSTNEYDLRLATVKDGEVTLLATRDGQSIARTFHGPATE